MGTVTPVSFLGQDLLPWRTSEGFVCDRGDASSSAAMGASDDIQRRQAHGPSQTLNGRSDISLVRVGRLNRGRQAPAVARVCDDGYISVRVDRRGSHVGNPFCSAPTARLCQAYNELLRTMLTVQIDIDESRRDFDGMSKDTFSTEALLTSFEETLLHSISEKHHVRVHGQRVRPLDLRAWLVHHAQLLPQGHNLQLHSGCACGTLGLLAPWTCHARLLAGALLWLAHVRRADLLSSSRLTPCSSDAQVLS